MKKTIFLFFILTSVLLFTACSSKQEIVSNKSALFWYKKIIINVANYDLNAANDAYSSLYSEHISSIFLPQAMLLLSKAYALNSEFIFSKYYLNEYLKRFGNKKEQEYVEYLKVKIAFMSYNLPLRNQKALNETISSVKEFIAKYKNSNYTPLAKDMLLKLELGSKTLKDEIASLYERIKKPKGAMFYRNKDHLQEVNIKDVMLPKRSLIRNIFE